MASEAAQTLQTKRDLEICILGPWQFRHFVNQNKDVFRVEVKRTSSQNNILCLRHKIRKWEQI